MFLYIYLCPCAAGICSGVAVPSISCAAGFSAQHRPGQSPECVELCVLCCPSTSYLLAAVLFALTPRSLLLPAPTNASGRRAHVGQSKELCFTAVPLPNCSVAQFGTCQLTGAPAASQGLSEGHVRPERGTLFCSLAPSYSVAQLGTRRARMAMDSRGV